MYTREGFGFSSLPSTKATLSPTHLYLSSLFLSFMGQYVTTVLFSWDLGFKKPNSLLLITLKKILWQVEKSCI